MTHAFRNRVLAAEQRWAMPIAVYPGAGLAGTTVQEIVTNPQRQAEAAGALCERFSFPVALTAMDLSAEAEAFGCAVRISGDEVPTVIGRRITERAAIASLPDPEPGAARTWVGLEAIPLLRRSPGALVLGSSIGPFSLSSRIYGVSELLELTAEEPEAVEELLAHVTRFLIRQVRAIKAAGADGVMMAEPAAGLLSPRALGRFSSPFVRQIIDAVRDDAFEVILHNCAAKLMHLPYVLQSGARVVHFGAPMDVRGALQQVDLDVLVCGNLDPAGVFVRSSPDEVEARTLELLLATGAHRNFVASSGCDLPPDTPLENIEAFANAVRSFTPSAARG